MPARLRVGATRERASMPHLTPGRCTPPRSHPRKRGPCSALRRAVCVVASLANAPRTRSRAAWCGKGRQAAYGCDDGSGLLRLLPQTGLRLTSRSHRDIGRAPLLAAIPFWPQRIARILLRQALRSLPDLVPLTGTRSVNGSPSIDASAAGCLRKKLCVSKCRAGRIQHHLHGVLFAPFFGFFRFRSLSGLNPTNSWPKVSPGPAVNTTNRCKT